VPFFGRKTVQNAHRMLVLSRRIRTLGESNDPDRTGNYQFCDEGDRLAKGLHDYGHKRSLVNPDWTAAGVWTRAASQVMMKIARSEGAQPQASTARAASSDANPWALRQRFAGHAYDQLADEGSLPTKREEVEELIDRNTPDAFHDIGTMMA